MTPTPLANALLIPRDQIRPSPKNARQAFNEAELKELAATIEDYGVIEPLVVRYSPSKYDGVPFELIDGERRFRASDGILDALPCIVSEIEKGKERELSLIANLQRTGLSPIEEAHALRDLILERNISFAEAARLLGKSPGWAENRKQLLRTKTDVQEAATQRPDAMSSLLLIDKVSDKPLRAKLLQQVTEQGASVDVIRSRIQRYKDEQKLLKESQRAPDAHTRARISEYERNGTPNVSRGLPVRGDSPKRIMQVATETVADIDRKINTLERWGNDLTDAQKRKLQPEIMRLSKRLSDMVR